MAPASMRGARPDNDRRHRCRSGRGLRATMPSQDQGEYQVKAGDSRRAGSKATGGDGATEVRGYVHADKTLAARLEGEGSAAVPRKAGDRFLPI